MKEIKDEINTTSLQIIDGDLYKQKTKKSIYKNWRKKKNIITS